MNAWALLVTTKPPTWRDPLVEWVEAGPTLGEPHPGFFYPDPIGFWSEIRKWATELLRVFQPNWTHVEALSLTTVLHLGDEGERLRRMLEVCRPRLVLFLDEPSWARSGLQVRPVAHHITDPYRRGQVYEGFWGAGDDGLTVGKSPQHPSTHNLYRDDDMLAFLRAAPVRDDH